MARAQHAYDNQSPPEDTSCERICEDCDGWGCQACDNQGFEDRHQWKRIPREAKDGTTYCQCVRCGEVDES